MLRVSRATLQAGMLAVAAATIALTGVRLTLAETRRSTDLTHARELASQLADRYTAAVTQLGSDTLDVRLGGIYALESIAVEAQTHHRTVVEVLCAFVREHTIPGRTGTMRRARDRPIPLPEPWPSSQPPKAGATGRPVGPDTNIQAAHTVLGGLPRRKGVPRADLIAAVLTLGRLDGADLAGADLYGADLTGADLAGADLVDTSLAGARLFRATLTHAREMRPRA